MQQITKASELLVKKNVINRVTDVPGGCSIAVSNLVAGSYVEEGTPLTAPATGVRIVCKQAKVLANPTATVVQVAEKSHNFKVGDFIGTKLLGKAYAITTITNASGIDTLTVGTAIDTPTIGDFIYEMEAESASNTSALKNTPEVIVKSPFEVPSTTTLILQKDALVRADIHAGVVGSVYLATLPGVIEITY